MKILCMIDVTPGADLNRVQADLDAELRGSWSMFTAGILREAYTTPNPTRVVFLLEDESIDRAAIRLRELPLIAANLMRFELTELRPFVNWSRLFAR